MAVGSSTLATMRAAPPQCTQVVTSMLNTRLRRCAQLIERRRSSGVRGSSFALTSAGSASVAGRLPRPEGVSCARNFAFGAKMPWKRVRCARGGGTSAASLQLERITQLPKAQQRFVIQMLDTVLQQQAG